MRSIQLFLFTAIAVLGLAIGAQAAPVITPLGNYDLLPNTPGQKIPLYVTGILPNEGPTFPLIAGSVSGIYLAVAINEGGIAWGGTLGPKITSIDVDSGPTIWVPPNSPSGHIIPAEYNDGQLSSIGLLTNDGWVNVSGGQIATLLIDTTGFDSGTYSLTLSGGTVANVLGDTDILGWYGDDVYDAFYTGPAGTITIVPEPTSMVLAAIGLMGLAAWGWRRKR